MPDSEAAFRRSSRRIAERLSSLLTCTITVQPLILRFFGRGEDLSALISFRRGESVGLRNGLSIRVFQRLRPDPEDPRRVITAEYSYSYSLGPDHDRDWLLRYDYVPEEAADPEYKYPVGHVHFNGTSRAYENFRIPGKKPLHRLHCPTGRITLEDFMEHLIVELKTPARGGERAALDMLAESRARFEERRTG